jgi:hypothetical protein
MSEVGCLRRVEVVPRHLGRTKVDVGAVDALRILPDIETLTLRATRADAEGPSERIVQIPAYLGVPVLTAVLRWLARWVNRPGKS